MVGRLYRCIGSIGRGARGADGCIGSMAGGAEASGGRGGMVSGSDGASGGGCLITSENREKHTGRKKLGGVLEASRCLFLGYIGAKALERKKLGGVNIAHTSSRSPWRPPPAWWGAPGTKETLGLKNLRVPIGLEGVQTHHEGQDSGKGFKAIVGYQNGLE